MADDLIERPVIFAYSSVLPQFKDDDSDEIVGLECWLTAKIEGGPDDQGTLYDRAKMICATANSSGQAAAEITRLRSHLAEREAEVERLREARDQARKQCVEVQTWLMQSGWGNYNYMEGSSIYNDVENAKLSMQIAIRALSALAPAKGGAGDA